MKQCRGGGITLGVAFGPAVAAGGTAANMYVLGGKASNIGKTCDGLGRTESKAIPTGNKSGREGGRKQMHSGASGQTRCFRQETLQVRALDRHATTHWGIKGLAGLSESALGLGK